MKKLVLTGILALVLPGSLLQIFVAIVITFVVLMLQSLVSPMKTASDNVLAFLSAVMLRPTTCRGRGMEKAARAETAGERSVIRDASSRASRDGEFVCRSRSSPQSSASGAILRRGGRRRSLEVEARVRGCRQAAGDERQAPRATFSGCQRGAHTPNAARCRCH